MQLDVEINEIVRESFKTTKKYIWKGVFAFLFYFAALFTFKDGILPIMAKTFPPKNKTLVLDRQSGGGQNIAAEGDEQDDDVDLTQAEVKKESELEDGNKEDSSGAVVA